jgi:hypothetical protein
MDSVTGTARCCRFWAVLLYTRIGRCGVCGDRPRLVAAEPPWDVDAVASGSSAPVAVATVAGTGEDAA